MKVTERCAFIFFFLIISINHSFAQSELWGMTSDGRIPNLGVIFKMTASGTVTVLHNFAGTDGSGSNSPLIQGSDGNFYGEAYSGGTGGAGVVFKITSSGTYTVLHNFTGTSDGNGPNYGLMQATNGVLYGITTNQSVGVYPNGTIFSLTTSGTYTTVYVFNGSTDGGDPLSPLRQHTNGLLYGTTDIGGDQTLNNNCFSAVYIPSIGEYVIFAGCGVVYNLNIGAAAFASLQSTSGKEGAKINILGQGFGSTSVVKFGGTQATTVTRSGTTFLTATVPAAALTGSVTVTTGTTKLTSSKTFKVTPTLSSFTPTSGPVGTIVTITGTGLMQTTKVTFNKLSATFTVNADTQVTATVPTGATTGKIAVTTKGGSATSTTGFTVN